MTDPYLSQIKAICRLTDDYKKHKKLIIAFDFDDTIFDFHKKGYEYPVITDILLRCQAEGHTLILYTCNEGRALKKAVKYCEQLGLKKFHVNQSPVKKNTRKPYFNILLDDRAGLGEAYFILCEALKQIRRSK